MAVFDFSIFFSGNHLLIVGFIFSVGYEEGASFLTRGLYNSVIFFDGRGFKKINASHKFSFPH